MSGKPPVASKEPWEVYPNIWKNQTAFFTYIRGVFRLAWSRFPAKLEWKKAQMTTEKPAGYTGRGKSFGKCHYCGDMFTASSLEVDHLAQAGSCNNWDTAQEFLRNLLDCNDNWALACKPCHKVKSYAERTGLPFVDALIEKRVIEVLKDKKRVLAICKKYGYSEQQLSNNDKRREALVAIFKEHGLEH